MRTLRTTTAVAFTALAAALTTGGAPAQAAPPKQVALYQLTSAQMKAKVAELTRKGYRPISLSVSYGPRYTSVWRKASGPDFIVEQDLSIPLFEYRQKKYHASKGYQPVIFDASGPYTNKGVYVALYERRTGKSFSTHGTNIHSIVTKVERIGGLAPASITVFGTNLNPMFGAVFTPNRAGVKWEITYGYTAPDHQAALASFRKKGYRPLSVTVGPNDRYSTAWIKDGVKDWQAVHHLSGSAYMAKARALAAKGYRLTQVDTQVGRWAAVFVRP